MKCDKSNTVKKLNLNVVNNMIKFKNAKIYLKKYNQFHNEKKLIHTFMILND